MINIHLTGGLGNIMFQVAAMESMAKDYNLKVNYPNISSHLEDMKKFVRTETYDPKDYFFIFKDMRWMSKPMDKQKLIEIPFAYVKIVPKDDNYFKGYFQSEKYFVHNRELILKLFEPSYVVEKSLAQYFHLIDNKKTCSIHVRRGDYLLFKETHFVQDIEYFKQAIGIVGQVDQYIVCSDDIPWCKENLVSDTPMFFVENEKDYVEMFLMSKCTHNIISNSSFSWWAAWMNSNPDKIVVAPEKWWSGNCDDIVPINWIKI